MSMNDKSIRYGISAGILAAGIGSVVKRILSERARKKSLDTESNKNTIVVGIKKDSFLKDLPTPEEKRMEEKSLSASGKGLASGMSAEEVKKNVVNGRRFDFMGIGKKAGKEEAADPQGEDWSRDGHDPGDTPEHEDAPSSEKGEALKKEVVEGRVVLRDQAGRFAAPTDPMAVEGEKNASWSDMVDFVAHPVDSAKGLAKRVWGHATDQPLMYVAGGALSLWVAKAISDAINKRRSEESDRRSDDARQELLSVMEDVPNEKNAADDDGGIAGITGRTVGAAFFVPMALTALITSRIIENRRREKKENKEKSNSYPDEPIVLYKTSSDKEVEISPETALALMSIRASMLKSAHEYEASENVKSAQDSTGNQWAGYVANAIDMLGGPIRALMGYGGRKVADGTQKLIMYQKYKPIMDIINKNWENGKLSAKGYDILASPQYDKAVYDLARMMASSSGGTGLSGEYAQKINAMRQDPRTNDLLQNKFTNEKAFGYSGRWGKWKDEEVEKSLNGMFGEGNEGFMGILKSIFGWLAKNTGIGGWMMRRELSKRLAAGGPGGRTAAQATKTVAPAPATPAPATPATGATAPVAPAQATSAPAPAAPKTVAPAPAEPKKSKALRF